MVNRVGHSLAKVVSHHHGVIGCVDRQRQLACVRQIADVLGVAPRSASATIGIERMIGVAAACDPAPAVGAELLAAAVVGRAGVGGFHATGVAPRIVARVGGRVGSHVAAIDFTAVDLAPIDATAIDATHGSHA